MSELSSYPKVVALGNQGSNHIFGVPVQIEEKIDGSQFSFAKLNGKLVMRNKGQILNDPHHNNMFYNACHYVQSIEDRLPEGVKFYTEYIRKRRHNCLGYDTIPTNHLVLWAIKKVFDGGDGEFDMSRPSLLYYARALNIDVVPAFENGIILKSPQDLVKYLKMESYLGGTLVEGLVIKPLHYLSVGVKLVSPSFREKMVGKKSGDHSVDPVEDYFLSFKTEARWNKAIFHLRDADQLSLSHRDIGPLMKELHQDITDEEEQEIKNWLFCHYQKLFKRTVSTGFADYYKQWLIKQMGNEGEV
jgi:hypothetical protein